ncbi:MAG: hypothetical protein JSU94_06435 [Phycisphaerales bacterium]|nr:MAG: hypothetical protein JSU94_06435 [Phycisphaerales bacterium]
MNANTKKNGRIPRIAVSAMSLFLCAAALADSGYDKEIGVRLFYRILGSQSNGPFPLKTRTVAAPDGAARIATTGMANAGFTEYPFCRGDWSFTFRERYGLFPRFAGAVPIDPNRVNTADILVDWTYEPDGCLWGPACREFAQTFVATGKELVSLTLLVASPRAKFVAALHEGRPDGRRIGPSKTFFSGHSMEWGTVRWAAAEAPLEPGKTYCIRLCRDDGAAWNPYFHSTGNVYDSGHAFFDGVPRPESDLALWIMQEPEDVSRALIVGKDPEGWLRSASGFRFIPRTPNVKMITVEVTPVKEFCVNLVAFVYQLEPERRLLAGPKYTTACARPNTSYEGSFLFGPGELECRPGKPCFVEVLTVPWKEGQKPEIPPDRSGSPKLNIRPYVYGLTSSDEAPIIYNVKTDFIEPDSMAISWRLSKPADVQVHILSPRDCRKVLHIPHEVGPLALIDNLPSGADCHFRLLARSPARKPAESAGPEWRTPTYGVRVRAGKPAHPLWPETPEYFVPLAPRPVTSPLCLETSAPAREIPVPDGDFEHGLGRWKETVTEIGTVSLADSNIKPFSRQRMYGWTHRAQKQRRDVLLENGIYQTVPVKPGRLYRLAAHAVTDTGNGPRGDTRVRLAVDPNGKTDFKGKNSGQWFWTDAEWMQICHTFRAASNHATLFVGFFRWRDLDRASAYVDNIKLYDLGPPEHPTQ